MGTSKEINSDNHMNSDNNGVKIKVNKKIKRGNKSKNIESDMVIFSTNAAQLKGKLESLKSEINDLKVTLFTFQETHYKTKGRVKMRKRLKERETSGKMKRKRNLRMRKMLKE